MRLDDVLRRNQEEPDGQSGSKTGNSSPANASDPMDDAIDLGPPRTPVPASHASEVTPSVEAATKVEPVIRVEPATAKPALETIGWHSMVPSHSRGPLWDTMPLLNRLCTIVGGICVLLAFGRMIVPPVADGVQRAYYPHTVSGKLEVCTGNLRSLTQALTAYAADNDGRFPPLDYQNAKGQRITWGSLASGYMEKDRLMCPVGPGLPASKAALLSSYAMNPVLAMAKASDIDDASSTVLLADIGGKHDLSLLPPYPSWPSFRARPANGALDASECNFDFRHGGQAAVAYLDGQTGAISSGNWASEASTWGGSAVMRLARERLRQRGPQARELFKRLQADDISGAAEFLTAHRAVLNPVSEEVAALWRLNSGEHSSDSVDKLGWDLARAWKTIGDASLEKQFDAEQTRRCQAELERVNGGTWEQRTTTGEPAMRCQAPHFWTAHEEQEGRYKRLYLRSALPSLYALLEVSSRASYVTPRPINWLGEDRSLQRRYGSNYRRVNLGSTTLNGQTASVWEYELEKPGGPLLHKRLVGYTDGWSSYVISCSAPARDWELWKPNFDKIIRSVNTGYL